MSSTTSLVASQVRLHEWALQIQECRQRPAGVDVATWCAEHNITKANYYYRLRRVREALLQQENIDIPSFVEITPRKTADAASGNTSVNPSSFAASLAVGKTVLQISDQASEEFLRRLIGAMKSC